MKKSRSSIYQKRIDTIVAKVFLVRVSDFKRYTSNKTITTIGEPRMVAMYLQRELLNMSYPKIAAHFSKKSHYTAMYAYQTISGLLETESPLRKKVQLCRMLYSEYTIDNAKQRYNLHYLLSIAGVQVSSVNKTIYMSVNSFDSLSGIIKNRIVRLQKLHNYQIQLIIE